MEFSRTAGVEAVPLNRRVVSLLPASTEIVAALGAGDSLVGVTHECDFPIDAVRDVPRVTRSAISATHDSPGEIDRQVRERTESGESLYALDETVIGELMPDVIVTQALCDVCAVSENDVRAMGARLGSRPAIVTMSGSTWDGIADDIRRVGDALSLPDAAESLVASLDARLLLVHEKLKAARAPRPRVVVIEWTDPIFAAGHWVPELVRRAGGQEMMSNAGDHSTVRSVAGIRDANPEILIVAPCGNDVIGAASAARALLAREEWSWARAIPVFAIDANSLLSRPGPRLVDGMETLAAVMHPALFGVPDSSRAVRVECDDVR